MQQMADIRTLRNSTEIYCSVGTVKNAPFSCEVAYDSCNEIAETLYCRLTDQLIVLQKECHSEFEHV